MNKDDAGCVHVYVCVCIYMNITQSLKKRMKSCHFTITSVDLEGIMLSEISQGKTSAA